MRQRFAVSITMAALTGVAIADPDPVPPPPDPTTKPDVSAPTPPITPPAPVKPPEPTPLPFTWVPYGYLRMQYIAVQDDPNVAFVGRNDGFELQNARLGVYGTLGTRASYAIAFDGAIDERTQVNTPQGSLGVGLRDAWGQVALGGGIVARGGFFQAWDDPTVFIPDTSRETVDLPLEVRGMRATEGYQTPGLTAGRSLGVSLRSDPGLVKDGIKVGFEVAAQNGADEFSSNNDNDSLALSAALIARMPHDGWLIAAFRYNPRTIGMLPFRQDETDYQGIFGARFVAGPVSISGGLVVMHTTYDTTMGPSQNSYGAHGQLMFTIPMSLPLAVGYRFAILDPSSLITTDQVMEHTVGATLGMPQLHMRLQLQLTHVVEQSGRELTNDRAQLAMELAL